MPIIIIKCKARWIKIIPTIINTFFKIIKTKLYPVNSYAYKNRALIYIEEKKWKEACEDLSKANELGYTRQYGKEVNELITKYCN